MTPTPLLFLIKTHVLRKVGMSVLGKIGTAFSALFAQSTVSFVSKKVKHVKAMHPQEDTP